MAKFLINDDEIVVGEFLKRDGTKKMEGELKSAGNTFASASSMDNRFGYTSSGASSAIYRGGDSTSKSGAKLTIRGTTAATEPGAIELELAGPTKTKSLIVKSSSSTTRPYEVLWNGRAPVTATTARDISTPASWYVALHSTTGIPVLAKCNSVYLHRVRMRRSQATNANLDIYTSSADAIDTGAKLAAALKAAGFTSASKVLTVFGGWQSASTTNVTTDHGFYSDDGSKVYLTYPSSGSSYSWDVTSSTFTDIVVTVRQ